MMERLTEWYDDKKSKGIMVKEAYGEKVLKTLFSEYDEGYLAMCKLKQYEDKEEQGKLLPLPCFTGDTVYTNVAVQGWYLRKDKRPYKATVVYVGLSENPDFNCFNVLYGDGKMWQFKFSDIGKTVFMTEKEAKEALEREE